MAYDLSAKVRKPTGYYQRNMGTSIGKMDPENVVYIEVI